MRLPLRWAIPLLDIKMEKQQNKHQVGNFVQFFKEDITRSNYLPSMTTLRTVRLGQLIGMGFIDAVNDDGSYEVRPMSETFTQYYEGLCKRSGKATLTLNAEDIGKDVLVNWLAKELVKDLINKDTDLLLAMFRIVHPDPAERNFTQESADFFEDFQSRVSEAVRESLLVSALNVLGGA